MDLQESGCPSGFLVYSVKLFTEERDSRRPTFIILSSGSGPSRGIPREWNYFRKKHDMHIQRRYTVEGSDPFGGLNFVSRASRIVNPDGSVVFEMKDLLAPEHWSQVAVDVLAQKYFRRAGLPAKSERVHEEGVPEWAQRSAPAAGDARIGHESDARQVFRRLAGCWTY